MVKDRFWWTSFNAYVLVSLAYAVILHPWDHLPFSPPRVPALLEEPFERIYERYYLNIALREHFPFRCEKLTSKSSVIMVLPFNNFLQNSYLSQGSYDFFFFCCFILKARRVSFQIIVEKKTTNSIENVFPRLLFVSNFEEK